jgi:hypothetical protein
MPEADNFFGDHQRKEGFLKKLCALETCMKNLVEYAEGFEDQKIEVLEKFEDQKLEVLENIETLEAEVSAKDHTIWELQEELRVFCEEKTFEGPEKILKQ